MTLLETVQVHKKKINLKDFKRRTALDTDYHQFIDYPVRLVEDGRLIGIYLILPERADKLVDGLKNIKYLIADDRTQGLLSTSRTFGYKPRETMRTDFCSSASLARDDPTVHAQVCEFAKVCSQFYKETCPDLFQQHEEIAKEKIRPEWVIEGTPFTSGIINKNNPLKYHFDTGNFETVYSNMVAFKKYCSGGHLSIPEYDIGLEIANNSLLFFDGQKILHGVTPFKITQLGGYRFTIVYYTLKAMWNCLTVDEELVRIRAIKTQREKRRAEWTVQGGIDKTQFKQLGKIKK